MSARPQANEQDSLIYDATLASVIKLSNGTVLYLREVSKFLVLVCVVRGDKFKKQGLIDYNFDILKKAIAQVVEVSKITGSK